MNRLKSLAIAAAFAGAADTPPAAAGSGPARVGAPAPRFTIHTFDGRKVRLEDYRGKVLVINYWATWCGPCKAEMPMMSAFHRAHKSEGFEILGLTTEDSVPQYKLRKVAELLSYPLADRLSGAGYDILGGVPTSYVIDRRGIVRYAKSGSFGGEEFEQLILPLLAEGASGK